MTAVELSECTNMWLWICTRSDIYSLNVIINSIMGRGKHI